MTGRLLATVDQLSKQTACSDCILGHSTVACCMLAVVSQFPVLFSAEKRSVCLSPKQRGHVLRVAFKRADERMSPGSVLRRDSV